MMLIIFQPNINNNLARLFLFLLVLVVLAESDSPNCTQLHFATPFTKCEILFDQCPATSPADSPPPLAFRSCQMQKCSRLGVSDVCKSSVPIELDEPSCYRYCCKSSAFSAEVCLHNNEIIQNNTESMNSYLFASTSAPTQSSSPAPPESSSSSPASSSTNSSVSRRRSPSSPTRRPPSGNPPAMKITNVISASSTAPSSKPPVNTTSTSPASARLSAQPKSRASVPAVLKCRADTAFGAASATKSISK